MNKTTHLLIPLVALTTGACNIDLGFEDADPRAGDRGRLAFRSEGCTTSTVMAVGGRATLRLEPLDGGALPADLSVAMSEPSVIDALRTTEPAEVAVFAKSAGRSYLSVRQMGLPIDGIELTAVPARSVRSRSAPRVLLGGHTEIVVEQAMGLCDGQLCELFGTGFLDWRSEPAEAFALESDEEGVASFSSEASGTLLGREPTLGNDLVKVTVDVVSPDAITGFQARIVALPDGASEPVTLPLPATLPANSILCLRLDALVDAGEVPLSRRDVSWSFDGGVLDPIDGVVTEPQCTLIATGQPGKVTLRASSPLFGEEPSYELTLE